MENFRHELGKKEYAIEPKTADFSFNEHLGKALLAALYYIFVYIPFILPFKIWGKAASRISAVWDSKSIAYDENKAKYPLYLFYFNYIINFMFDAYILLAWPLGLIYIIIMTIISIPHVYVVQGIIIPLIAVYVSVVLIRFAKETLFFIINNLISWLFEVIINIGKFIKNLWLLNFVFRRKECTKSSDKPVQKIDLTDL